LGCFSRSAGAAWGFWGSAAVVRALITGQGDCGRSAMAVAAELARWLAALAKLRACRPGGAAAARVVAVIVMRLVMVLVAADADGRPGG
jgi:hypothetical protein